MGLSRRYNKIFKRLFSSDHELLLDENGEEYEELMKGSVPCPSCKGLGKIPIEQEAKLIALIPYTDDRLKPRRTSLYVSMSVVTCFILSTIILCLLFPRTILLRNTIYKIQPYSVYINKTQNIVSLAFKNTYDIINANYFPIYVKNATMSAIFDSKRMKTSYNLSGMKIPYKRSKNLDIFMNITFDQEQGGLVATFCSFNSSWFHTLFMEFQTNIVFEYLLRHEEQVSISTYQYVNCGPT